MYNKVYIINTKNVRSKVYVINTKRVCSHSQKAKPISEKIALIVTLRNDNTEMQLGNKKY